MLMPMLDPPHHTFFSNQNLEWSLVAACFSKAMSDISELRCLGAVPAILDMQPKKIYTSHVKGRTLANK